MIDERQRELMKAIRQAEIDDDSPAFGRLTDKAVTEFPDSPEFLAIHAHSLWWRGLDEEAHAAMDKALQLGPECAIAWGAYAEMLSAEAQFDDALAAAERALSLDEGDAWVVQWSRDAFGVCGESAKALELAKRRLELWPDQADTIISYANALRAVGRGEEADAFFNAAERRLPNNPALWRIRARKMMVEGRITESIRLSRRAVEEQPGSHMNWAQLASALCFAKEEDKAIEAAMKALEICPRSFLGMRTMARICRQQGCLDKAAEWEGKASKAFPAGEAQVSLAAAEEAAKRQDWNKVLAVTEPALSHRSVWTRRLALNQRSRALVGLGRFDEAIASLDELWSMGDFNLSTYHLRDKALQGLGNVDEAMIVIREGLGKYPTNGELRASLLRFLHAQGRKEEETALVEDITLSPPDIPGGVMAAWTALNDTDHPVAARMLLRVGKERFPKTKEFALMEAMDKLTQGNLSAAKAKADGVEGEHQGLAEMVSQSAALMGRTKSVFERIRAKPNKTPQDLAGMAKLMAILQSPHKTRDELRTMMEKMNKVLTELESRTTDDGSTLH